MAIRLSHEKIDSFCGNVLPLRLLSEDCLSDKKIVWRVEGDAVAIRTFDQEKELAFSDGVLLTLLKPGTASVIAEADGTEYCCSVSIRPMRTAAPGEPLTYYVGDFHDHTTMEHNHERFAVKNCEFPIDVIKQVRDEGKMDFHVISDHACTVNPRDFFRGFTDVEEAQPMDLVVFPGTESEISAREYDRYGVMHKNSGEIVTVNADYFASVDSWAEFYQLLEHSPFAVCALAHPQIVGYSVPGIWNFSLHKNNTPMLKRMVKMIEMGNGGDRCANLVNEYIYSVALDNGFKVSTTCSSDSHGPKWGYDVFPGKTVVMAYEKSKEAFLDAFINHRVYACESGNLKIAYSVNGVDAPADLPAATRYNFHVDISCFHEDASTLPVKCQVISDLGETVLELKNFAPSFDFTVESDTASYFYLRLLDGEGRKTWSVPVWTGREPAKAPDIYLVPLNKANFTAVDLVTGQDASALINDNPATYWEGSAPTASILIDMKEEKTFCGLGHYPTPVLRETLKEKDVTEMAMMSQFVSTYRVSVSNDGEHFTECASGLLRIFGGEEMIYFPTCTARYVKFEALTTVGYASELKQYVNACPTIGELTVFNKDK